MNTKTEILIIGGGFAGATLSQSLENSGVNTLLIDRKDYFEVTYSTLRSIAFPSQIKNTARKLYRDFLKGQFIQSDVTSLTDSKAQLANGDTVEFSKAIIASGSRYPTMPLAKTHDAVNLDSRNKELVQFNEQLQQSKEVLIIGAGVVGVELAGEIKHAFPNIKTTLSHKNETILNGFKEKAQMTAHKQLEELGVNIELNTQYKKQDNQYINIKTDQVHSADLVYEAVGAKPNNEFMMEHLKHTLNDFGYIKVDSNLKVENEKNLYALGDIADVGEAKLGYLAVEQGKYLAKSIINEMKQKKNKAYKRNPLMALIPVGRIKGVVQLPFAVTSWKALVNMKQKDLFISKTYKGLGTTPNVKS